MLAPKMPLVQGKFAEYVTANKRLRTGGDIQSVLQALNPDAMDEKGEWWAKIHSPCFFLGQARLEVAQDFAHEEISGPVAQLDRAAPS